MLCMRLVSLWLSAALLSPEFSRARSASQSSTEFEMDRLWTVQPPTPPAEPSPPLLVRISSIGHRTWCQPPAAAVEARRQPGPSGGISPQWERGRRFAHLPRVPRRPSLYCLPERVRSPFGGSELRLLSHRPTCVRCPCAPPRPLARLRSANKGRLPVRAHEPDKLKLGITRA